MAEILVTEVCARRLSAAGDLILGGVRTVRRRASLRAAPHLTPRPGPCIFPVLYREPDLNCSASLDRVERVAARLPTTGRAVARR